MGTDIKRNMNVTITTLNPTEINVACVKTLHDNRDGIDKVVIVNNASEETENLDVLRGYADQFIDLGERVSLAQSWNIGIEACDSNYVCVSNDDILFTKGWNVPLTNEMDKDVYLGILQPYNTLQSVPDDFPDNYILEDKVGEIPRDNFVGCCFVIRKDMITALKDFDREHFSDWADYSYFYNKFYPFGVEDQDFYRRVRGAGYKTLTHFGSYVHHFTGQTMSRIAEFEELQHRSERIYKERWEHGKV